MTSSWRFIPARAGNASIEAAKGKVSTVHPRTRGERQANSGGTWPSFGSSPHARGTHCRRHVWRHSVRFIPARAGNAISTRHPADVVSVHPRTRGERTPRETRSSIADGSSPHARGTLGCFITYLYQGRFIPARAGNAKSTLLPSRSIAVHPRTRGERGRVIAILLGHIGSSPHARGTRSRH